MKVGEIVDLFLLHTGEPGQVEVTESEDEPHRLVHNVKKSVIQEVNESVQPYRVLKQEVKPVIEQAHTLVAHGENIPLSGRTSGIIASQQTVAAAAPTYSVPITAAPVSVPVSVAVPSAATAGLTAVRPAAAAVQYGVMATQPAYATGYSAYAARPAFAAYNFAQPAYSHYSYGHPSLSTYHVSQPAVSLYASKPGVGYGTGYYSTRYQTIGGKGSEYPFKQTFDLPASSTVTTTTGKTTGYLAETKRY